MENHWKALFTYPNDHKARINAADNFRASLLTDDGQLFRCGKHYYSHFIFDKGERVYITQRQYDCLQLYKNQTMKQIAKVMQLSPRTIESYLLQLKRKLNCRFKRELACYAEKLQMVN